jgi:hypothetical protein
MRNRCKKRVLKYDGVYIYLSIYLSRDMIEKDEECRIRER